MTTTTSTRLPPSRQADAIVIALDRLVEEVHEGEDGEHGQHVELHEVVQPGAPARTKREVRAHLHKVRITLLHTGKIPALVEITLVVLRLRSFVLQTALLLRAAPSVKRGARASWGTVHLATEHRAAQHFQHTVKTEILAFFLSLRGSLDQRRKEERCGEKASEYYYLTSC